MEERLQKIIARAGVASRRHAEQLIASGQVSVNGEVITKLGSKADAARDHIKVSGKLLPAPDENVYIVLHKPPEVVATLSDPEGRPSIASLLRGISQRVFPVGRLEYHAAGLLFLTNDGELADGIFRAHRLPQTYWLKIKGFMSDADCAQFAQTLGVAMRRVKSGANAWYEATLTNVSDDALRQHLACLGHPVEKFRRTALAQLELGSLPAGAYRLLNPEEVAALRRSVIRALESVPTAPALPDAAPSAQLPADVVAPQQPAAPSPAAAAKPLLEGFVPGQSAPGARQHKKPWQPAGKRPSRPPREGFPRPHRPNAGRPGEKPWKQGGPREFSRPGAPSSAHPGAGAAGAQRFESRPPGERGRFGKFGRPARFNKPGGSFGNSGQGSGQHGEKRFDSQSSGERAGTFGKFGRPGRFSKPGASFADSGQGSGQPGKFDRRGGFHKPGSSFGDSGPHSGKLGKFGRPGRFDKSGHSFGDSGQRSGKPGGSFSGSGPRRFGSGPPAGRPWKSAGGGKFKGAGKFAGPPRHSAPTGGYDASRPPRKSGKSGEFHKLGSPPAGESQPPRNFKKPFKHPRN